MFRYIGLVWTSTSDVQSEAARFLVRRLLSISSEWRDVVDREGLRVLVAGTRCGSSESYLLHGDAGIVLGTLFERSNVHSEEIFRKAQLAERETTRILATQGRQLTEFYWGRYVTFLTDRDSEVRWVIRSPTGGIPCFRTVFRGVKVFFSVVDDCVRLGLFQFSVNWRYLTARVALGACHSDETALNEVYEVHAGECIELRNDQEKRRLYWHPFEIVRSGTIEDPLEAVAEMRATGKACGHAWASCYTGILHRLSGGLDSSIVLGCLQDSPTRPTITCVNYFLAGPHAGDQRAYARLAANRARCELVERERTAGTVKLEELFELPPSVNPFPHLARLETNSYERQLARERNATAVFTGDPGDSLFCRYEKNLALVDHVRRYGISSGLFRLATDVAPLVQTSIWTLLRDAVWNGHIRRKSDPKKGVGAVRRLVNASVMYSATERGPHIHPWFRPADDIPPGKLLQIRAVLSPTELFYVPMGQSDDPEHVYPLLSQPFVELCLRIPTYLHLLDGRDRGLARRAFAPDVPREILTRYWKGNPGRLAQDVVMRNLGIARELLLDGVLVREKILDRHSVEEVLSGRPTKNQGHALEVFEHALTEAWLRTWASVAQRIAA